MGACGSSLNKKVNEKKYSTFRPQPSQVPQLKGQLLQDSSGFNLWELRQTFNSTDDVFEHYADREIIVLNKLFRDLANRSPDDTISKETFLDYFELPGILGDRLFAVFDEHNDEVIDFQEFLHGLTRYNHGSLADKISMLFEIYDLDGDNQVKREELFLIINTVLTPTTSLFLSKQASQANVSISSMTEERVNKMVDEAFETCDTNRNGRLSQKQFTMWVEAHPATLQMLETVLAKHVWSSVESLNPSEEQLCGRDLTGAMSLLSSVACIANDIGRTGSLYNIDPKTRHKRKKRFGQLYYVIKDKFLYTFKNETDESPIKVIFIAGWYIKPVDDNHARKGWYGIEMTPPTFIHDISRKKMLYTKTKKDRSEWINSMQKSASTLSITQDYEVHWDEMLGRTHFSEVYMGTNKKTKKKYAIKIVDKSCIQSRERLNVRNEIAMMRLVNHPSIMRMHDVFADPNSIYMVMTLAPYGNFFARWKKRRLFEEDTARIIIWKLFDACKYLHSLGIVHRDLKPENILCLDETDDTQIVISDFGLSKFATPLMQRGGMTMPCGTLCYVAPEVLTKTAYGKKVDVWSIGCIMHLLLRGVLPFDGYTEQQIRDKTLHKTLNLTHVKWQRVSEDAKDLVKNLLMKDPSQRLSVENALEHRWFDALKEEPPTNDVKDENIESPVIDEKAAKVIQVNLL
eukprot:53343_1